MKREIKFRAWSGSQMVQVDQITMSECAWTCENGIGVSIPYQPHIPLMQYTGLKDKEGTEIYDGDIITWFVNDIVTTAEVYFDEQQASFWMGKSINRGGLVLNDWMRGEYLVIGNRYESPELLEAVNND